MDSYLDIKLLPDPEMPATVLMNSLFAKLHRYLVQHSDLKVGISFPQYQPGRNGSLGSSLRLHAPERQLAQVLDTKWLGGLAGYLHIGPASKITGAQKLVSVRRIQTKSNPERLARRYKARHQATDDDVRERYAGAKPKQLDLPFVKLSSASTGQEFRLFIDQQECDELIDGEFNRYGMSTTATLPWP